MKKKEIIFINEIPMKTIFIIEIILSDLKEVFSEYYFNNEYFNKYEYFLNNYWINPFFL